MIPVVAIIGRPNVGKSTLFNRLIGVRYAITSPIAGTTRDRLSHEAELGGFPCVLVDTGGLDFDAKLENIEADVQLQARIALDDADLIYFVIDATEPLTQTDFAAASLLRKAKKPIVLIAHKADTKVSLTNMPEMYSLGLGDPVLVSAIHGLGLEELDDATKKICKDRNWKKEKPPSKKDIRVSIVGKPNVGKSSLVNALLGEKRLIVSNIPGTTIDATDTHLNSNNQDFTIIDTAGLRRPGRRAGMERFGSLRAMRAISRSDITCLVIDWSVGLANQDLHVSQYLLEAGKGMIVLVNKVDLMDDAEEQRKKFLDKLTYRMGYAPWAPVIFISALERKNIFKMLDIAKKIMEERNKKISDKEFAIFTETTVLSHPPIRSGRKMHISKGIQTEINPPTFEFTCNDPDYMHFSYKRFLENEIRRKYGFHGTPIRITWVPEPRGKNKPKK